MKTSDQDLKWRLCDAYFSILVSSKKSSINIEDLCLQCNVSYDEVKKIIPEDSIHDKFYFLKILISRLDKETLEEFKTDISEDTISSTYDKILEGLTLRFEKFLEYKSAFKIMSNATERRVENFFKLLQQNYLFMSGLLDLVENNPNCSVKTIKSVALNILFIKAIEVFLKDESNNIDSTVRHLDKYLKDIEDIGVFSGIIKK